MKTIAWLLQKYDNGDFFLYQWTPILAKKGFMVLTDDQSKEFLKFIRAGINNVKHLEGDSLNLFNSASETNQKVAFINEKSKNLKADGDDKADEVKQEEKSVALIDDVVSNAPAKPKNLDEVRDISFDQEDIQIAELKHIKGLRHKSALESHMLRKYQCEIPIGRLETMKAYANSMISDLAKDNRLYYVEGEVVVK